MRPAQLGMAADRGSIAPAIPIIALVLFLLGGLVIDASRQLNARGQAVAFAEEASRAGVQAIRQNEAGELELVPEEVPGLVEDYCSRVRGLPQVRSCDLVRIEQASEGSARPFVVVTHVDISIPASLLGIVGVSTLDASGDGRAEARMAEIDPVAPTDPGDLP